MIVAVYVDEWGGVCDENVGAENAVSENAGPSSNAASLCCVCTAKRTLTSSKGIGVTLSWVFL